MTTSQSFTARSLATWPPALERLLTSRARDAKRTGNPQIRASFERTERSCRELAAKRERLAREPAAAPGALDSNARLPRGGCCASHYAATKGAAHRSAPSSSVRSCLLCEAPGALRCDHDHRH
jgi:hypothetical protein